MRTPRNSPAPPAAFLARHSAVMALALFAAVGAAVFADYGVSADGPSQLRNGHASFHYILGDENALVGYISRLYSSPRRRSAATSGTSKATP